MKKIKEVLLFVIILVLFVGVASAADISNDTNYDAATTPSTDINVKESVTDNIIETNEIQEKNIMDETIINKKKKKNIKTATKIYTVNDSTQLRNALSSTDNTVIININSDITLTSSVSEFNSDITKLTINGNNKTINGNNQYRFLMIDSNQLVTINNITITNCHSDYGGAIDNFGNLTISYIQPTKQHRIPWRSNIQC